MYIEKFPKTNNSDLNFHEVSFSTKWFFSTNNYSENNIIWNKIFNIVGFVSKRQWTFCACLRCLKRDKSYRNLMGYLIMFHPSRVTLLPSYLYLRNSNNRYTFLSDNLTIWNIKGEQKREYKNCVFTSTKRSGTMQTTEDDKKAAEKHIFLEINDM
jgi:hypothetical protein